MTNDLTAQELRQLLKLEPHATCGFVRVTFISKQRIAPGGLPPPFIDGRPAGSALYFMVTPDAPVRLHRIRNDQLYHRYLGHPIEVLMLHEDGTSERAIVGSDLRAGSMRAAFDPRQYLPHCARHSRRRSGLVPRREHRKARRRTS
jgi:predicted cupin superfamily sugar epimerase